MAKRGVSRLWTIKRRFIRPPLTLPISIRLIANGMPMRLSRHLSWLTVTAVVAFGAQASAETCPGHPDAIGTSRTIAIDPTEHPHIGTMQYAETLPLRDHEVVLTFDDGPLPRYSNPVLDILASQCVKATFFIIGRMAQSAPEGVRKLRDTGHSIGTHTQDRKSVV